MSRGRFYLAMLAGWIALTLTLTSIPNPEFGPSFPGADKLAHFGFYGVAGFLFVLWRREIGAGTALTLVWAVIFAALLGGFDEFHQQWIPGRSMDLIDWAADLAGGTAGGVCSAVAIVLIPQFLTPKLPPSSRPSTN